MDYGAPVIASAPSGARLRETTRDERARRTGSGGTRTTRVTRSRKGRTSHVVTHYGRVSYVTTTGEDEDGTGLARLGAIELANLGNVILARSEGERVESPPRNGDARNRRRSGRGTRALVARNHGYRMGSGDAEPHPHWGEGGARQGVRREPRKRRGHGRGCVRGRPAHRGPSGIPQRGETAVPNRRGTDP